MQIGSGPPEGRQKGVEPLWAMPNVLVRRGGSLYFRPQVKSQQCTFLTIFKLNKNI